MTFHSITHTPQGYQVFRTTDGRDRLDVGPSWPTPRSAARYVDALEAMPRVSPLRASTPRLDDLAVLGHDSRDARAETRTSVVRSAGVSPHPG